MPKPIFEGDATVRYSPYVPIPYIGEAKLANLSGDGVEVGYRF